MTNGSKSGQNPHPATQSMTASSHEKSGCTQIPNSNDVAIKRDALGARPVLAGDIGRDCRGRSAPRWPCRSRTGNGHHHSVSGILCASRRTPICVAVPFSGHVSQNLIGHITAGRKEGAASRPPRIKIVKTLQEPLIRVQERAPALRSHGRDRPHDIAPLRWQATCHSSAGHSGRSRS
jgi:hypothetical protein